MALSILVSGTKYEASIRLKIFGVNDSNLLPDEDINNSVFVERAERIIKGKLTSWSGLTGDDAMWLRDAVIAQTCVLLMPSVRNTMTVRESVENIQIWKDIDFDALTESLNGDVDYCLSQISTYDGSIVPKFSGSIPRNPSMFESFDT